MPDCLLALKNATRYNQPEWREFFRFRRESRRMAAEATNADGTLDTDLYNNLVRQHLIDDMDRLLDEERQAIMEDRHEQ